MRVSFLLFVPLSSPPAISLDVAPLVLDGLLLAALERKLDDREQAALELPLARARHGGSHYAMGSCAIAVTDGLSDAGEWIDLPVGTEHVHRIMSLRPAVQELLERTAFRKAPLAQRSLIGTSPYRPRLRRYATVTGIRGLAFVATGDPGKVVDLLGELPGLGAMSGQGYGAIDHDDIVCTTLPEDALTGLLYPDGCPARPLPVDYWGTMVEEPHRVALLGSGDAVHSRGAVQPPYWHPGSGGLNVQPSPSRLVRSLQSLHAELGLVVPGLIEAPMEVLDD